MPDRAAWDDWATFRGLCAMLRPCLGCPEAGVPDDAPWERLIALSSEHLVTPALAWSLRNAQNLPPDVADYMDAILVLSRERNDRMRATLAHVFGLLHSRGIRVTLLKGAAALATDLYPDPGIRMLGDLDILVPHNRAEEAWTLLRESGLERIDDDDHYHHLPGLFELKSGVAVEIHRHAAGRRIVSLLPDERIAASARPIWLGAAEAFVLDPTDRFIHAVGHTQIQDDNYRWNTLSLRQMLEVAALQERYRLEIDWDSVRERFAAAGYLPALCGTCNITQELFAVGRPPAIPPAKRNPLQVMRRRRQSRGMQAVWMLSVILRTVWARPGALVRALNLPKLRRYFDSLARGARHIRRPIVPR